MIDRETLRDLAAGTRIGPALTAARRLLRWLTPKGRAGQAEEQQRSRLVRRLVRRVDRNGVEVGAGAGWLLDALVRVAPHGRHTGVERRPELAAGLARRHRGVTVHPVAAGCRAPARLLDELVPADRPVDLLAIHPAVEALDVLRGAPRILEVDAPPLLFGCSPEREHQAAALWELLSGWSYDLYRPADWLGQGEPLRAHDFVQEVARARGCQLLALPAVARRERPEPAAPERREAVAEPALVGVGAASVPLES